MKWLGDPVAGPSAARALGRVDTTAAAEHLRAALDDRTPSGPTRGAAAAALGESGALDAVWLLLPLLDDADGPVRAGAIGGLGALIDGGLRLWERHLVAWTLTAHLESGRDDTWRTRNALAGLAQALPAVRRLADRASAPEVRVAALSLLNADDVSDADARRFTRGLDDPHEAVRCHAVLGLTRRIRAVGALPQDDGDVAERLAALAASETSVRLRRAADEASEALGSTAGDRPAGSAGPIPRVR